MSWLLRNNWPWSLVAFFLGALITWILLERRQTAVPPPAQEVEEVEEQKEEVLVGASVAPTATTAEAEAPPAPAPPPAPEPEFSQLMDGEETLFDHLGTDEHQAVPGRYGEGSAEAVPHQGPPDGFTIKGNAQSMLFHTPDSPYYGRTKPEVWFRTEADAERAGFTKYTRRPRKSPDPRD
ncbi:hypothetical protein AB0E69_27970 [Kribbella sp. NPDC026611]|uniref:sunset domain-containing protein n=1 Tax=Kribbella sp. NPDC026611 TaxID=3154911 RepID=UPI00340822A8